MKKTKRELLDMYSNIAIKEDSILFVEGNLSAIAFDSVSDLEEWVSESYLGWDNIDSDTQDNISHYIDWDQVFKDASMNWSFEVRDLSDYEMDDEIEEPFKENENEDEI